MAAPNASLFPSNVAVPTINGARPGRLDPEGRVFNAVEAFLRQMGAWGLVPVSRGGAAPGSPAPYQIHITSSTLTGEEPEATAPEAAIWNPYASAWQAITTALFARAIIYYGLPSDAEGYLFNDGTGTMAWATPEGGEGGGSSIVGTGRIVFRNPDLAATSFDAIIGTQGSLRETYRALLYSKVSGWVSYPGPTWVTGISLTVSIDGGSTFKTLAGGATHEKFMTFSRSLGATAGDSLFPGSEKFVLHDGQFAVAWPYADYNPATTVILRASTANATTTPIESITFEAYS